MHFHFNLHNLSPIHRYGTQDLVDALRAGLEDCGHAVTLDDRDFLAAPVINLILERFSDKTVESLRDFKSRAGDGLILGIVGGEDLEDPLVMDGQFRWRRDAYMQAIEIADFVWTVLPNVDDYSRYTDAGKVFRFELGYSDRLRTVTRAPSCDTDVFLPGNLYPYRERVVAALEQRGIRVRASGYGMPIHVYRSIAGRAKVILDVAREPGLRFLSGSRILLGINNGITVVSEGFDTSPLAFFYDYTVSGSADRLVDLCIETVRRPDVVKFGRDATDRFKRDRPMQPKVARLLSDPGFITCVRGPH